MNWETIYSITSWLILSGLLIAAAIIDYKRRVVPNGLVIAVLLSKIALVLVRFAVMWGVSGRSVAIRSCFGKSALLSIGGGLLAAIAVSGLSRLFVSDGLGMGDVKLMLAVGFYQELTVFLQTLAMTTLPSVPFALVLLATGKAKKTDTLPFAPFLAFGAILSQVLSMIALK